MRIGFFPNMGKSNIMAVLKMAAHICKDEGIEVFLPDDLESDAPARVLKIPETHILSRPEIFKQIDIAFSFGGMVPSSIWQDKFTHIMYLFVVLTLVNSAF